LASVGLSESDLKRADLTAFEKTSLPVSSPWPVQAENTAKSNTVWVPATGPNYIEVAWPANHLCQSLDNKREVRAQLRLSTIGRVLSIPRNKALQVTIKLIPSSDRANLKGPPKPRRGPSGPVPVPKISGGNPISIQFGQQWVRAPFSDRMWLHLMPGAMVETLEGGDALKFVDDQTPERLNARDRARWWASFVAPGYIWRDNYGKFTTAVQFYVNKQGLVTKLVYVVAQLRLRDSVYWAIRSHGGHPGSTWDRKRALGPDDPIVQIAMDLARLPTGSLQWEDYRLKISWAARMDSTASGASQENLLLHLHTSAAASLLLAQTSRDNSDTNFREACTKASAARVLLSRAHPSEVSPLVRADLALLWMESCLCAAKLSKAAKEDAFDVIKDLVGNLRSIDEHHRAYVLDLKNDLEHNSSQVLHCSP
jgi:hypothetical protein